MPRLFPITALVLALAAALTALVVFKSRTGLGDQALAAAALIPDRSVAGIKLPEFTLTTQAEKPFTRDDFLGKVTVVDFMFTHCPFICPLLTSRMASMTDKLRGTDVRFVSFSVDPSRDTPARLRDYAEEYKLDISRWTFVTGDFAVIQSIAHGALGFNLEEDPKTTIDLPGGEKMNNISHPGAFALIGPTGELLGFYAAKDEQQIATLTERARRAAQELSRRRNDRK